MLKFVVASATILVVLVGRLYVQELYRRFTRANPQLGPFRDEASSCGRGCCSCSNGSCTPRQHDS